MAKIILTKIKKLDESSFELVFERDGVQKRMKIAENHHWIAEIGEFLSTVTSEDAEFYEIWANASFRKEVSRKLKNFSKKPQLQAA